MSAFVPLAMQIVALKELQKSAFLQGKFILLVGKSGLGKSFLLHKLCENENFLLRVPFVRLCALRLAGLVLRTLILRFYTRLCNKMRTKLTFLCVMRWECMRKVCLKKCEF